MEPVDSACIYCQDRLIGMKFQVNSFADLFFMPYIFGLAIRV